MSSQILHGDCRNILPTIPDSSIDAIVTDPPYELSNDGKASAARVALEIMFPQNPKVVSGTPDEDCLGFLLAQIALLCSGRGVPTESATMPEGAVALDDQPSCRDHDVQHCDVASVYTSDRDGRVDAETEGTQYLGCFAFKLADLEAGIDALNRSGTGFVSGGVGIGFAVPTASLPGFLGGGTAIPDGDDVVGALNDALAALVGAGFGAEDLAMPSVFNVRPGTHERCSAGSALTLLALAKACGAQLVRTRSGAGGLPAVVKATRVSVVHPVADRALSFDLLLHDVNLSGVGFMGKGWDGSKIAYNVEVWRECLRVLKPGGHLLAFGGTRTYHRMACAIEDAGFEVRDSIHWLYGSGFPKSLDVSKAIDKVNGKPHRLHNFTAWMRTTGLSARRLNEITGTNMGGHYLTAKSQPAIPTAAMWEVIRPHCGDVPEWVDELVARIEAEREVVGTRDVPVGHAFAGPVYGGDSGSVEVSVTAPATDAAKRWEGWGTALKPAHEPIIVARKPLDGTVAANVLTYGTGALNIDGCRIGNSDTTRNRTGSDLGHMNDDGWQPKPGTNGSTLGRWPANVVIDQHIAEQHPEWANYYYCPKASTAERNHGLDDLTNGHPTVKPLNLMRWLVRLVTPPDGTVLDPFAGSGTTLTAATLEHRNSIGIELTAEYLPIIHARTLWAQTQTDGQLPL